jgi:phosphohistidine phosphatase
MITSVTDVAGPAPPVALLVRHAHAEWPLYSGRDFDRPLTPRGEEDAMAAAQALRVAGLAPTLILSSPARRARQTAEILARVLGVSSRCLQFVDTLYNARLATLELELRRMARPGTTTLLVAHNPGISELARKLCGDPLRPALAPAGWDCFPLHDAAGE